ncbi:hypothetical protein [Pseudomonas baetica]|uniref:hypothetical protein n=1 Tax=Pseudomonas baetica TaxID=674054 RepID=UPI0024071826|nr:hypothetical protein [Pseudomonas baetica]MDF9778986.1 hypothetical protein [Pseudomonas baetica]
MSVELNHTDSHRQEITQQSLMAAGWLSLNDAVLEPCMTDDLFKILPDHQTFVIDSLLADLKAEGWNLIAASGVSPGTPVLEPSKSTDTVTFILKSEIARLDFEHEHEGVQHILVEILLINGRVVISDYTKHPSFHRLVSKFISGLHQRMLREVPDSKLTSDQLRAKHEEAGERACFTKQDWKDEVSNGETLRGYWDWVHAQIEQAGDESEAA